MSSSSNTKRGGLVLPRRRERKNSGRQQQQQQQEQQTATISDDDITVPELVELDDATNNNNNDSYLRSAQEKVVSFSESAKNIFSGTGRQNGCLIRPRRILSSKKFELSIRRAKQQQQQETPGSETTDSNKKKPCETNSAFFKRHTDAILSNMNPQQQQQNQSASASLLQQAMAKKMALSSYGHGTNGIRVVNGKLKTLTISWLGALEGSHFGHLLRREFFAASSSSSSSTLVTNNGTQSADSAQQQDQQAAASSTAATTTPFSSSVLFAEPASKRALCCVAIRYNKGYADYMKKNKNDNDDDTIAPLTEEEIVGNVTPFHVVGVLSMEEPVLQLTFPDDTEEAEANCATVGTEIAVFYTPGLILGVNDSEDEKQQNNKKLNTNSSTSSIVNDPNSENYNPLVTPNGELRCSLCVEMTYSGFDDAQIGNNNKNKNNTVDSNKASLKVQEAALIPHDDNSWIPFRSWVAQMIREKRRKALEEIEQGRILKQQQQQSAQQKMKQDQSSGTNDNNKNSDDDANAMMMKTKSSLPQLSSPMFGALKTDNFTKKLVKKNGGGGGGELASGLDYDSSSSSSSDDDDDDNDVVDDDVDFKNFKLNDSSNYKPGTDASS